MAKQCFCGCGRDVPFGRKRIANMLGERMEKDLAMFQGALERAPDPEHDAEVADLIATGRPIFEDLKRLLHGELDRKDFDKEAGQAWMERAADQRKRLFMDAAAGDYAGWNAIEHAELLLSGVRASAEIVAVEDTGTTINDDPRVLVRLRVETPDGSPLELERKVLVSRLTIPRAGERVEVAYDPEDPTNFTFKNSDLTDGGDAPSATAVPIDELEKLAGMLEKGLLTREEFDAAKKRLLS
jgi:hypothetical protein